MFIRKALARGVGVALGLCVLAAVPATADSDNGYGYLSAVEGSATIMQTGSGTRTPAEVNQPVLAGDRLWVPARSRVEIVLADRNLLRIDGGSEVALERLAASPDSQDRGTILRLTEGNLQLVVVRESLGDEMPRIDTPNATIYVQDYGVFRIAADQQIFTEVVVRSGRAEVVTDRTSEKLRADQQAFIEGESRIDVDSAGSYDNLERWASRLDEEGNVDSRYVGDDLRYAAAPLSRHGSWIDIEGSHYWRPRVAADWRPYSNGRWLYTPSGNTWVSYDSWGWVPHHYGSWDYINGYGWVWQPGNRWAPAWVYWYQGPSYTGWCPTGYYSRYYGSRWGRGFGVQLGVYGWAGGDWGHFNHWTFVSSDYWRGYRNGYRDGRHDDWRNHRNVQRYAVPIDDMRRRGPLDRGLITTDTRRLTPDVLQDGRRAVAVLREDPSVRRGRPNGDLPDVSDFIARKPDLPSDLRRAVSSDDGRTDMGRGNRDDRQVPSSRAGADSGREPGRPMIDLGGSRPGRSSRPSAGDAGGAPRPGTEPGRSVSSDGNSSGDSSGVSNGASDNTPRRGRTAQPMPRGDDRATDRSDRTDSSDRGTSSSDSSSRSGRDVRPTPRADDADRGSTSSDSSPRMGRGAARRPSDSQSSEPPSSSRSMSTGRERPSASRPEPSDRQVDTPRSSNRPRSSSSDRPTDRGGSYERPSSSSSSSSRPSSPRMTERPAPRSTDRGSSERPSSSSSPRASERPSSSSSSSSSRDRYEAPSRSEPRVSSPPPSSSDRSRSGSSTRSAPERRSGGDRGTSSSGGRSSSRRGSRDGG